MQGTTHLQHEHTQFVCIVNNAALVLSSVVSMGVFDMALMRDITDSTVSMMDNRVRSAVVVASTMVASILCKQSQTYFKFCIACDDVEFKSARTA